MQRTGASVAPLPLASAAERQYRWTDREELNGRLGDNNLEPAVRGSEIVFFGAAGEAPAPGRVAMVSQGGARTDGLGAYYALDDLAGIGRRTAALVVDLGLVFVVCGAVVARGPEVGVSQNVANALAFSLAWLYLGGLKTRPTATLGYRMANVQLVDLQGKPASLWKSTCRFLFLFAGPMNVFFDLVWLTNDSNRQTLRDKLTGTYVIRRGAQPLGHGPITYPTYFIATLSFIVPNVSRGADPPAGLR